MPGRIEDVEVVGQGQVDSGQEPDLESAASDEGVDGGQQAAEDVQLGGEPVVQEEPWRAALGEAVGGVATEVRQAIEQMDRRYEQRFNSLMRGFQTPRTAPTQAPQPKPEVHPFDDPYEMIGQGADPKLVKWFRMREARSKEQLDQIQRELGTFREDVTRRRQGDEMANHFSTKLNAAMGQHKLEADKVRRFLEPMMLGLALTTQDGNPYSIDVLDHVKAFAAFLGELENGWKAKHTKAAAAQEGLAPIPPGGQGTVPKPAGATGRNASGSPQSMADMDKMWDNFAARHSK